MENYSGGFCFAESDYYGPNIYATRLALDILGYVDIFNGDDKDVINIEKKKIDIINFVWSCFDENVEAFRDMPTKAKSMAAEVRNKYF